VSRLFTFRTATAIVGLAVANIVTSAVPAHAAPPINDTQAGAIEFGVGFTATVDTSEATVDAGEQVARDYCLGIGAPAFEHAVWFKTIVPAGGSTSAVALDVTGSDYGAGMAILSEAGGALSVLDCVPRVYLSPAFVPEGTYYVVVFGDGTTQATGGNLVFTVSEAPPPPDVTITVNPTGTATREGGAWITGSVTCAGGGADAQVLFIEGQVSQTVGRLIISSYFFIEAFTPCDGATYPWEAYVPPTNGKFAGGKAATVTIATACNAFQCSGSYVESVVKLNKGRR
jgi:hypothetical protein